jgi:hypothetical protein
MIVDLVELKKIINEEISSVLLEMDDLSDFEIQNDFQNRADQEKEDEKIPVFEEENDDDMEEVAPTRKRVIRKGTVKYKMKCPGEWSWSSSKKMCVKPNRQTQIKRSRAAKKGNRIRRARRVSQQKSRTRSLRKLRVPRKL